MLACETLDGLGLHAHVLAWVSAVDAGWSVGKHDRLGVELSVGVVAALLVAAVHHQPLVLLLGILLLEHASCLLSDVGVLDSSEILTTISLNDDQVADVDLETGVV